MILQILYYFLVLLFSWPILILVKNCLFAFPVFVHHHNNKREFIQSQLAGLLQGLFKIYSEENIDNPDKLNKPDRWDCFGMVSRERGISFQLMISSFGQTFDIRKLSPRISQITVRTSDVAPTALLLFMGGTLFLGFPSRALRAAGSPQAYMF
jgi:hypothetical protein